MRYWRHIQRLWPLFALVAFYGYLLFHALSGNQGLVKWVDYEQQIETTQAELARLQARRQSMEARADSLRLDGLDLDALDIRAREAAFLTKPEELTIWLDPTQ